MARTIAGVVTSAKGNKTIVITAHVRKTHPLYRKQFSVSQKYMAHDEANAAKVGDQVIIAETRPISRRKAHKLERIVEKPKLRQEALVHTAVDDSEAARPSSKSKAPKEESEAPAKEAAAKPKPKQEAKS